MNQSKLTYIMADQKEPLQLADEKIEEIQKKLEPTPNQKNSEQDIFARINGIESNGTVLYTENTVKEVLTEKEQIAHSKPAIKNLRTFQGDVAEAMKKQGTSVLSIALAEKKREQETKLKEKDEGLVRTEIIPKAEKPIAPSLKTAPIVVPKINPNPVVVRPSVPVNHEARNRILLIVASIVLIVLGIGAVGTFYVFQKNNTPIVSTPAEGRTIVAYNKASAITIDSATEDALLETLARQKREQMLGDNETLYISLVQTSTNGSLVPISPAVFFSRFENSAPPALIRAFGAKMMYGLYKTTANEPFLLIRVDSFDNAYAGMLEFEKTMLSDLGKLFRENTQVGATQFEDETVRNKDIRIIKATTGETLLLYSFIDKETLLITADKSLLQDFVNKVADQKLVR